MTPIIPPIWLYLFEVLSSVDSLLFSIVIVSLVIFFVYGFVAVMWYAENGKSIWVPKKWICIIICFVFVLSVIGTILIPSQETMIYMAGLSFVTPDNVEYGTEIVKSVFDYVITALGMGENLTN
jgi:hypothetical protein